ncbi:IclR family transcriptional regulator C-terminal domain-containing protein [Aeromicrobium sp. CTD01-1L150]|uniref:IclR family transcriptional regulator domain-containing protein n=1 Tax=Aeromicrobium sp. CTD01-1L150 TaxID=3341830 RepID=UPI0035C1F541
MTAEGMAGLAKGLAILEAFDGQAPRLTISESATATSQSRATARRCLLTLVDLGYLSTDGKYFSPTPRLLRLGAIYGDTAELPQLAGPHLSAVRESVNEAASLAVRDRGESLFIARSETQSIVNAGVRVGARLPLYASATGHVLLLGLSEENLTDYLDSGPFPARTPRTPTSSAEIRERVESTRANGFAVSDEELEVGLLSIAVPVSDSTGKGVASMSVSASAARISLDELKSRALPTLQRQAELLGRQL